jgi:hypothetical protein
MEAAADADDAPTVPKFDCVMVGVAVLVDDKETAVAEAESDAPKEPTPVRVGVDVASHMAAAPGKDMTYAVAQAQHVLQPAATAGTAHMYGHVSSLACSHKRTAVHVPQADVPARSENPLLQASVKLADRVLSWAPVLT